MDDEFLRNLKRAEELDRQSITPYYSTHERLLLLKSIFPVPSGTEPCLSVDLENQACYGRLFKSNVLFVC